MTWEWVVVILGSVWAFVVFVWIVAWATRDDKDI